MVYDLWAAPAMVVPVVLVVLVVLVVPVVLVVRWQRVKRGG
jgi:hypothetical protein